MEEEDSVDLRLAAQWDSMPLRNINRAKGATVLDLDLDLDLDLG